MKKFLFILIVVLTSCKEEKSFADYTVLSFPKDEKLTFQEFNEDSNEAGSDLLYIGLPCTKIETKYYRNIMSEPPPPPKKNESEKHYNERIKNLNDSINNFKDLYFRNEEIEISQTKENFYDSLSNKNLSIMVRENDTIPLYKRDYETNKIKKHKAYPIFIQNISAKTLKIPIDASGVALYISNNKQFQSIRNSNYMICGMGTDVNPYFELKPNEILIYSFPHLKKGQKRRAKISFYKATSKDFEISIDEKIIKNQRSTHYIQ